MPLIASLKRAISRILFPDLTALHWRCYSKALTAKGLRGSILRTRVRRLQRKFCADVPIKKDITPFTTPHGLSGIFISKGAVIGEGCTLFQQVTIGSNTLQGSARYGAPILGRNVYIGAGAKIIGRVTVGDNVRIGANCVVVDDIPPNATVVMEKPRILLRDEPLDNTFHPWPEQ